MITPAGRLPTRANTPLPRRKLAAKLSAVSVMAVEGGSSGGRAPKALWMTSTIAAASCGDAIETTRSETETLTSREA